MADGGSAGARCWPACGSCRPAGVVLGAGVFCLVFNVVFYIGAWKKINGIIGDVVSLARSIPFIGEMLGEAICELTKSMLYVHVSLGFWLFVPAGLLLIAGGVLRLRARGGGDRLTAQTGGKPQARAGTPEAYVDEVAARSVRANLDWLRENLLPVRVIYTDLDGTMVGPLGCFFRDSDWKLTLRPARALLAAHARNVDVMLVSGRHKSQLSETARLLGCMNYVAELGTELVYNLGTEVVMNIGDLELTCDSVYQTILDTGVVDLLLESFPRRLEMHSPWSDERDCTPLMRGNRRPGRGTRSPARAGPRPVRAGGQRRDPEEEPHPGRVGDPRLPPGAARCQQGPGGRQGPGTARDPERGHGGGGRRRGGRAVRRRGGRLLHGQERTR